MTSSYAKNNYGQLFESLAAIHKPDLIVELGVLDGYSLLALARGAPDAKIIGIDLFEDYEYKHGNKDEIYKKAYREMVKIELIKEDAFSASEKFLDNSIDILHCDISNDGFKLLMFLECWIDKIKKDGLFIFEGGSEERDNVGWMKKYNKTLIQNFKNCLTKKGFEYVTLNPFPSLTICRKIK